MRDVFVAQLLAAAESDSRIMLITGDLGFGVLEKFERSLPARYLNVGVAEQNMTAVATGLALEGFIPFTYSIGNFPTLRCLEQLRNDALYHDANVKVVCVGGGFTYGSLGMSHHATEDLSILRALPNIAVVAPANDFEASAAVRAVICRPGPAYVRLERTGTPIGDPGEADPFQIGRARVFRSGSDVAILAIGGIVSEAMLAAELLASEGISAHVLSMHSLKPFDAEAAISAVRRTNALITVEENSILGGLAGAAAEVFVEHGVCPRRFARLGMRDEFSVVVGDQAFLRKAYQMDAGAIAATAKRLLAN